MNDIKVDWEWEKKEVNFKLVCFIWIEQMIRIVISVWLSSVLELWLFDLDFEGSKF